MDNMNFLFKLVPKEKLIGMLKPHLPMLVNAMREAVATMGGATPDQRTGVMFFSAELGDGRSTTMATVFALDSMDGPATPIGTIDVVEALDKLDLASLLTDPDQTKGPKGPKLLGQ